VAKPKRVKEEKETQKAQVTFKDRFDDFMRDWGRVAIPAGLVLVLLILRNIGVLDDTSLGFVIGLIYLGAVGHGFLYVIKTHEVPAWARVMGYAVVLLLAVGALIPLVEDVYPGTPVFQKVVTKADKEAQIDPNLQGYHHLEVFAQSLANKESALGLHGKYHLRVQGKDIKGEFSDQARQVRAGRRGTRSVELKHLMDVHGVTLEEGEKKVEVLMVEDGIGPELRLQLFKVYVPPAIAYIFLSIAVLLALFMDAMFRDVFLKWRLGPWAGMVVAFYVVFSSSYERGAVVSAAVWSALFGGALGFTLGWLLSLIARRVGKVFGVKSSAYQSQG
jgi:hypothetical protein